MKHPELRQKGEEERAYIHRIAKLPTLGISTLLFNLFWVKHKDYHSIESLRDWIKQTFPKTEQVSYVYWDSDYETVLSAVDKELKLGTASVSTKKFAEWVVKDNIFESWRGLGEKTNPHAELFIELVSGKTGIEKKTTQKTKANRGRWKVRDGRLKAARKVAKALWVNDGSLTIADIARHDEIQKVAPKYGGAWYREHLKDLAPSNRPGRRKKK